MASIGNSEDLGIKLEHIADADAAIGDQGATQNTGWGADSEAHFDEIRTKLNANATTINAILAALEKVGILAVS